jgi:DNA-binding NarL/FixJ family response regulator
VSAPAPAIRVAIVEDQFGIREGLRLLIDGTEGYRVTGSYRSIEHASAGLDRIPADVVLVDLGLPGISGVEGIRLLKQRYSRMEFLVLTVYEDDDRIFAALCAGARGYLLKKTAPARLLDSIREVVEGGAPMSPEIARRVVELFRRVRPQPHGDYRLTQQESRLLRLLVEGHTYKTAGAELGVTVNTVSFHVRRIYEKLQVHSKSEAVAKALRERLF